MSDGQVQGDAFVDPQEPGGGELHRHRRVRRVLAWLAIGLSVVLVGGTLGAVVLVRHYENQLGRVALTPSNITPQARKAQPRAQNFLLVGSDTRSGVGGAFGSANETQGQRSDSIILAHFPADAEKPTLVSFPRDAYVSIPAHRDSRDRPRSARKDKLNAAYALGGPRLLVSTIEELTGLPVDHYVEINFAGFERMVDALGGVTLCARTSRNDPSNGPLGGSDDFMTAGVHEDVSGAVALAFVRNRHSFPNGDIARIQNQQHFLSQMIQKAISRGTLTNPPRLNAFLSSVAKSLKVDERLSVRDMQQLALRLRQTDAAHARFVTVPFQTANGRAVIDGRRASVVLLDPSEAQLLFAELRGVRPTSSPRATGTARPGPPPPDATPDQLSCGA